MTSHPLPAIGVGRRGHDFVAPPGECRVFVGTSSEDTALTATLTFG